MQRASKHTWRCPNIWWLLCLDTPLYGRMPSTWLDTPCMVGCPPHVWTSPVHLDAPHMFGQPHMFGCPPVCLDTPMFSLPYMFGCLLCLDTPLYGWITWHVWTPRCMFGCPSYFGCPLFMLGCHQMYGGIQRYQGHPNIWGCPNIQVDPNIWGHPNVWGAYGHPLSLIKHAFFVLYMYSRHPNIF